MVELKSGAVLNESYKLIDLLGRGGMGEVWRGQHLRLPKEVAVKILTPTAQSNAEAVARFRREAEISSRLGHPNIVEILDFNTLPDGRAYIVMELLVGEDLRHRLSRSPLPTAEALEILNQIAAALQVAHRAGVVHRDLKPENIFLFRKQGALSSELCVKVLDFGISKIQGSQTLVTRDHDVLGTPAYMSPEQASGKNSSVDAHTDQFALATIGYEMFSGQCAFAGDTLAEVVHKVVYENVTPLVQIKPELPRQVTESIDRAMAKDPGQRFADVAAFIRHLTLGSQGKHAMGSPAYPGVLADGQTSALGETFSSHPSGSSAPINQGGDHALDATRVSSNPALESTLAPWETGAAAIRNLALDATRPPLATGVGAPLGSEAGATGMPQLATGSPVSKSVSSSGMKDASPLSEGGLPQKFGSPLQVGESLLSGDHRSGARVSRLPWVVVAILFGLATLLAVAHLVLKRTTVQRPVVQRGGRILTEVGSVVSVDLSVTDAAPRWVRDGGSSTGKKDADPGLRDSSLSRGRSRPPARGKTFLRREAHRPTLDPEVTALLKEAQAALDSQDFSSANRLASRALRKQTTEEAFFLRAKAYCGLRDIGMVQAMLRNLPRRWHGRVWKFWRSFGQQGGS